MSGRDRTVRSSNNGYVISCVSSRAQRSGVEGPAFSRRRAAMEEQQVLRLRGARPQRMRSERLSGRSAQDDKLRSEPKFAHSRATQLYPSSFLASSSLTSAGFAWPFDAFITWPTKKAITVFLPPRYCSSCLGLPAMTSSIIFSMAAVSVICCGFSFRRWPENLRSAGKPDRRDLLESSR